MTFNSVTEMLETMRPVAAVAGDRVTVSRPEGVPRELVDRLAASAVFGATPEIRGTARWLIRSLGAGAGIQPSSIHDLYMAMGRGEVTGFTVPAINVRAMAYTTGRAVFRAMKKLDAGAVIFEIARSEVGYTAQRPHEYAAVMTAAALREGVSGPLFLQGDHVQVAAKKYSSPDRDKELKTLKALIAEEIAAGFYNIDIDTSTLVDLNHPTVEEQQRTNFELAANFTEHIRTHEPKGITISVGGEIGEVGGKNSDVHELRAFMNGYNASLRKGMVGLSKISVQTGTAHGGFVMPDGSVKKDVKIDIETLGELSRVGRREFGIGGAVQHGASTLPLDAFDAFPRVGACEIHLATDFQNMMYDHPMFPEGLKGEMYAWIREHAAEERKPKDTEDQFIYKARKKALGPFKDRLWDLSPAVRDSIGQSLEERFTLLMQKLQVPGTASVVARYVKPREIHFDRAAEVAAAGGAGSAAEKKAEGLAD